VFEKDRQSMSETGGKRNRQRVCWKIAREREREGERERQRERQRRGRESECV
jgi:hypothetical protein